MNDLMASALSVSQYTLLVGFLVFLRVGAAISLLPAFGEQSVPMRVKLGVAVAFTLIVAPAVPPENFDLLSSGSLRFFITETLVGLTLGIGVRIFVFVLQIAGSIAAQSTSLSQLFGGASVEPLPAISHVLVLAGLAIAVSTGLHVRFAQVLVSSYDVFPAGEFLSVQQWASWGMARIAQGFGLAFALAAPFVVAALIYNVALGVINKAMPQLMVALVGAPAISGGALILLALTAPFLLSIWVNAMNTFLSAPFGEF